MQLSDADQPLIQSIEDVFGDHPATAIGVAVSGGGDSMAMLHLMHHWAAEQDVALQAVTVDHGLREAAAGEAKAVAEFCAGLRIDHTVLRWVDWDGKGNLQDQARRARYRLMTEWAEARGISTIALGHTRDDQAETFLLRLARGSSVDGLSGMQQVRHSDGITWLRPLLGQTREALRGYLRRHNIKWIDDASNEDERFDRVKARKAIAVLSDLGISVDRLAGTAENLQPARAALELQTCEAAQNLALIEAGDVLLEAEKLAHLPTEIRGRLLAHTLQWVSSAQYRPRRQALAEVEAMITAGKTTTLHSCYISVKNSRVRISREYQAVKDAVCPTDAIWDQRWQMSGPHAKDLEIRALGEAGLADCPDWRTTGIPRTSLLACPAIWQNRTLIAAPMAGLANEWVTTTRFGLDHFISSIISH